MGGAGVAAYASLILSGVLGFVAWRRSVSESAGKAKVIGDTAEVDHDANVMGGYDRLTSQYAADNAQLRADIKQLRADHVAEMADVRQELAEVRKHGDQCEGHLDTERGHRQRLEAEVVEMRRLLDERTAP